MTDPYGYYRNYAPYYAGRSSLLLPGLANYDPGPGFYYLDYDAIVEAHEKAGAMKPPKPKKVLLSAEEERKIMDARDKAARQKLAGDTRDLVVEANPKVGARETDAFGWRCMDPVRLWSEGEIVTVIKGQNRLVNRGFWGRIGWLLFGEPEHDRWAAF